MAEIDRQQASRQKQAPEKQPERAPQSRAAPQTAAAFLQALLAGAGVEQIPLQTAEQIAGQIGNSALAALPAGPRPPGRQMPLPPEACGTEPLEIEASAPAGSPAPDWQALPPLDTEAASPRSLGEPGWGWQFFAPV